MNCERHPKIRLSKSESDGQMFCYLCSHLEILETNSRRQQEHDAICNCNRQTNVATGLVSRYPLFHWGQA